MGSRVWAGGESVDAELPQLTFGCSALPGMRPARWGVDADDARPDTGEHHPGDVFERETSGTGEQCSICVERDEVDSLALLGDVHSHHDGGRSGAGGTLDHRWVVCP
jgi:hypothetical protein